MNQYDVAVIGGGPGGYIAAIRSAQLGKKTVLVEKRELGGTCLNRGCIPTKALLHSSEAYNQLNDAKSLGIVLGEHSFQYKKMAKRKDKVVKTLRSGVENLVAGHGVTIVRGEAVMTGSHSFSIGEEEFEAGKIILATGSIPAAVPIPGVDKPGVLNSDGVLALEECPDSVVIIGGGVIGVEFATLFGNLGKKVTILEMMPVILAGNDPDISRTMKFLLEDKGVEVHTSSKVLEIQEGLNVVFEQEGEQKNVEGEIVIVAIGRKPEIAGLGLDVAGVKLTDRGFVETNEKMETNVSGIYAIGDITGKIQLAHVASAQAIVAAENCSDQDSVMDYSAVPNCIYSMPEVASVGMTVETAEKAGFKVKTGSFDISGNGRSLAIGQTNGFVKLVVNAEDDKILGCHMINAHATEMIGEAALAIQHGLTSEQLGETIHAHPTVSESIMEAAHDVHNLCCHKL